MFLAIPAMALTIACGVVGGLIGAAPFFFARSLLRRILPSDAGKGMLIALALVFVSLIIMVVEFALCQFVVHASLLLFALPAIVVFIIAVAVYAYSMTR
ncbi:MAG: hypothetical protein LBL67_06375 [Coriobacteriales bacterium]|jgi:hypothetical protein|nr:hypothetical protein [Coriobacteriales bacterium]